MGERGQTLKRRNFAYTKTRTDAKKPGQTLKRKISTYTKTRTDAFCVTFPLTQTTQKASADAKCVTTLKMRKHSKISVH